MYLVQVACHDFPGYIPEGFSMLTPDSSWYNLMFSEPNGPWYESTCPSGHLIKAQTETEIELIQFLASNITKNAINSV